MKNTSQGDGFYQTSKFDGALIGVIIFFSLFSILWVTGSRLWQSKQIGTALIYHEGKLLEKVDLQKDRIIPMLNGKMELEVKEGKIRVLNSDCPQHICMNMGWIEYSGQTIACLPNKVLVEVQAKENPFMDVVAY